MKFKAWVLTDENEWLFFDAIRWIDLDKDGRPVRICGPTGLQYNEFDLEVEG